MAGTYVDFRDFAPPLHTTECLKLRAIPCSPLLLASPHAKARAEWIDPAAGQSDDEDEDNDGDGSGQGVYCVLLGCLESVLLWRVRVSRSAAMARRRRR